MMRAPQSFIPVSPSPRRAPSRYTKIETSPPQYIPSPQPLPPAPVPAPTKALDRPRSTPSSEISSYTYSEYARFVHSDHSVNRGYGEKRYAESIQSVESSYSKQNSNDVLLDFSYPRVNDGEFGESTDPTDFFASAEKDVLLVGGVREEDDYLHEPTTPRHLESGRGTVFTRRGFANLGCMVLLITSITFLFAAYPMITYFKSIQISTLGAFNLGGTNASGQVPDLINFFSLIDPDTPTDALHHMSFETNTQWDLVFSDEFNRPNRTFFPGDDPYWEAVDMHYYATNDLEYYSPEAAITEGGSLKITLSELDTHGLKYQSAMLQSWNKFCFTGGYVEVSVSLPGLPMISGLWPAVWTMGNLGRAGYGATTDGTWPYSYDACDVGTLANQTLDGLPTAATSRGDPTVGGALSFLPGQRLSACTCPGEHHPGPIRPDGSFAGRSAPEIDVLEAIVDQGIGKVSQSAQWAPFDDGYNWANGSTDAVVFDSSVGGFNSYRGGAFQESTSGLFKTDQSAYSGFSAPGALNKFSTYGFEYKPGLDGYITWMSDGVPSWSVGASAVGANDRVNISARPIPEEPMYLLANLGISPGFGQISPFLKFPATMYIDYIRVYQDPNAKNIGCSPKDFPTEEYIQSLPDIYSNPNITTFAQAGQTFPRNRLIDTCT